MYNFKPKKRKFTIKLRGFGTYHKDIVVDKTFDDAIAEFFSKPGSTIANEYTDKTLIEAFVTFLRAQEMLTTKSSIEFEDFYSFSNDVDPEDESFWD